MKYQQKSSQHVHSLQTCNDLSLFSLNCQSAKSKAIHCFITDLVIEHDIDIFALSETWFTDNESDHIYVKALTPPGIELFNVLRMVGSLSFTKIASKLFQNPRTWEVGTSGTLSAVRLSSLQVRSVLHSQSSIDPSLSKESTHFFNLL